MLQQRAASMMSEIAAAKEREARCNTRAAQVQAALEATAHFEEADGQLQEMRIMLGTADAKDRGVVRGKLDVRLYGAISQKNAKIGDLISRCARVCACVRARASMRHHHRSIVCPSMSPHPS